jgi:predicted alpha/beta-fold hydrolase
VRLSGSLRREQDSRELLVVVHGLGGSSESVYARSAAAAAERAKISCLRINLRGADLRGEDLYHAGLSSDLDAALQSPALANFEAISVLGYSLGGHVALRYAATTRCSRVRSVAVVCPPLDLKLSAQAFDRPAFSVYRKHVLSSLHAMYRAFARRHPDFARVDPHIVDRIDRIQVWDETIVVPRHGFDSADHYYEQMSAARVLADVAVPTLVVHAATDPMVPIETVRQALRHAGPNLRSYESKQGGHVGFPANFSLGQDAPPGLEAQLLAWSRAPSV